MRIQNSSMTVADADVPISMGASFVSDPIYLGHIVNFSIQVIFTGTPTGNFVLQYSNDEGYSDKVLNKFSSEGVVNWTTDSDSAAPVTAAGDVFWDVQNVGARWVRVQWTQTAGTGSVTVARCQVKGV